MADKRKVLIVDDNQLNLMVASAAVENLGFATEMCKSGKEAAEKAITNNYFFILMDCMMPEMDGYATTRKIRETEKEKNLIIALTGADEKEEIDACFAAGMNDYIKKPISLDSLKNILAKHKK